MKSMTFRYIWVFWCSKKNPPRDLYTTFKPQRLKLRGLGMLWSLLPRPCGRTKWWCWQRWGKTKALWPMPQRRFLGRERKEVLKSENQELGCANRDEHSWEDRKNTPHFPYPKWRAKGRNKLGVWKNRNYFKDVHWISLIFWFSSWILLLKFMKFVFYECFFKDDGTHGSPWFVGKPGGKPTKKRIGRTEFVEDHC